MSYSIIYTLNYLYTKDLIFSWGPQKVTGSC
jgi:hypothetical protein